MAIRKNKKRIDPRYFLSETTYRDEEEIEKIIEQEKVRGLTTSREPYDVTAHSAAEQERRQQLSSDERSAEFTAGRTEGRQRIEQFTAAVNKCGVSSMKDIIMEDIRRLDTLLTKGAVPDNDTVGMVAALYWIAGVWPKSLPRGTREEREATRRTKGTVFNSWGLQPSKLFKEIKQLAIYGVETADRKMASDPSWGAVMSQPGMSEASTEWNYFLRALTTKSDAGFRNWTMPLSNYWNHYGKAYVDKLIATCRR